MYPVGTRIYIEEIDEHAIFKEILDFDFDMPTVKEDKERAEELIDEYKYDGYFTITKISSSGYEYYVNNTPYFMYSGEFKVYRKQTTTLSNNVLFKFNNGGK